METTEKILPIKGEIFTVEGHTAFIIMSEKRVSSTKTPWVCQGYAIEASQLQSRDIF